MILTFWGTRGSIPTPGQDTIIYGGNTTCLDITLDDGTLLIFDAGTGIKKLGQQIIKANSHNTIHLFFTHSHWDHIHGFPLFRPAYSDKYEINIYGYLKILKKLQKSLNGQMDFNYFPVKFDHLKAKINFITITNQNFQLNSATISCIENNHPGNSYGFKVFEGGKSIIFITDNELIPRFNSASNWNEYVAFCSDADVLIHDAHYLPKELIETEGFGHSSYDQAFDLAIEARVKQMIFFHHDPDRTDKQIETILDGYRNRLDNLNLKMKLDAAKEGSKYRI